MSTTGRYDLIIEQGATLTRTFSYQTSSGVAINLTGYTARMQIRSSYKATTIIATLTTENGGISITPSTGSVTILMSATATAALSPGLIGVYDIELITGTTVIRLIEGEVIVNPEVTK